VDGDAGTASAVQPRQALLRFDDLFGDSRIPVDAVIDSATLALRTSTTSNSHSADAMSLVRMLGAWSDSSTWSSLGGVTADGTEAILAPNATFVPAVNGGVLSMDVTESLYAWRSGAPNRGWALLPGGSDGWRFESAESALVADRPALTVTYTVRLASADLVIAVNEGSQTQSQAGCPVIVGRASVTKQGPGTVVFDAVNGHTGTTVVESGTLVIGRSDTLLKSPLVVRPGAAVVVGPGLTLQSPSVTVAGGMIDVGRGRIEIAAGGSSEQQLRADVIAGRSGGGLAGRTGIVTSASPAGESTESLVGYRVFADGSAVVSWAAAGDTNLDRVIDILDVADVIAGGMFNTGLAASWSEGDFGYDGVVDILDVADFLATNLFDAGPYDGALAPQPLRLGAVAAVPEPNVSGLTMCLVGLVMAASRRRRQSSAGVSSRRRNNWSAWSRGQRVAEAGGLDALLDHLSTSRPG
jgi:autotransporter-associated beta strand protein